MVHQFSQVEFTFAFQVFRWLGQQFQDENKVPLQVSLWSHRSYWLRILQFCQSDLFCVVKLILSFVFRPIVVDYCRPMLIFFLIFFLSKPFLERNVCVYQLFCKCHKSSWIQSGRQVFSLIRHILQFPFITLYQAQTFLANPSIQCQICSDNISTKLPLQYLPL